MPKPKSDGGWILPEIIDPARRCLCIPVPDEPAHRQAFFGALLTLGYQFNWQRDPEHKALPVSLLWMEIVTQAITRFNSGVDYMCFSCEELTTCLEPLFAQQQAAFQAMLDMSKYGTDARPGTPMTEAQRTEDLAAGTNPTCNLDITWAQAEQIVAYGDALITDALQIAAAAANDIQLAAAIAQIPGLDELGADAVASYAMLLQEGIAENYAAQFTLAYAEETACAIFCRANNDCEISMQDIYAVFYKRVTDRFGDPIEAFVTITDLLTYMLDQDIDGTIIADVMFLLVFGGGILAQTVLGDVGVKPLKTILFQAVNDANNDWTTKCDECPQEEWCKTWDFEIDDGGFQVFGGHGIYVPGVGWQSGGSTVIWLYREDFSGNQILRVSMEATTDTSLQIGTPYDTLSTFNASPDFDENPQVDVSLNLAWNIINNMAVRATIDGIQVYTGTVKSITICGFGEEPVWLG